ncbi:MAG: hypothetical protein IJB47_08045 [Oscillospiraceae bacterium]|nr:hypothetical protein [Oscillospiraceae bacterium]MBQ4642541.1 hypothetical protein [Oscillospiraceae bacterium]
MDSIRQYVLRIVAVAILCGICQSFFEEKKANKAVIRMVTGLLLSVTILSPIIQFKLNDISDYLSDLRENTAQIVADGESAGIAEQERIIKERCEAYILDKANSLNLELGVQVHLADDQSLHPECVRLTGAVSPYAQSVLRAYISDTLGIPEENQQWSIN